MCYPFLKHYYFCFALVPIACRDRIGSTCKTNRFRQAISTWYDLQGNQVKEESLEEEGAMLIYEEAIWPSIVQAGEQQDHKKPKELIGVPATYTLNSEDPGKSCASPKEESAAQIGCYAHEVTDRRESRSAEGKEQAVPNLLQDSVLDQKAPQEGNLPEHAITIVGSVAEHMPKAHRPADSNDGWYWEAAGDIVEDLAAVAVLGTSVLAAEEELPAVDSVSSNKPIEVN